MDFMRLLRSFEELLYEVIVMLVFFPRTLWLTLRHPQCRCLRKQPDRQVLFAAGQARPDLVIHS